MRKRILALLIVTVLTTGLIVGCGKKNTNVVDNTASEDVTTSPEDVTPEEETTASTENVTTEEEGKVSTEDVTTSEDDVTTDNEDVTFEEDDVTTDEDNSTSEGTATPTKPATTNPTTVAPTVKPTVAPTKPATTNPTTVAPTKPATTNPTTVAPTAKPTVAPTQAPTAKPTTPAATTPAVKPTEAPTVAPKVPSNWKKVQVYYESRECSLNYYTDGTWVFEYTGDPLNSMDDLYGLKPESSYLTITYRNRVKWAKEAGLNPKGQDGLFLVKYLGDKSDLELPKTIDGYDVLGIDGGFFIHSPVITSVTIPETFVYGFFDIFGTYITKVVIKGTQWDPAMGCPDMRSEIGTVIYCEKEMYERLIQSDLMTDAKFKSLDGKTVFYDEHENIIKEYPEWHNPTI